MYCCYVQDPAGYILAALPLAVCVLSVAAVCQFTLTRSHGSLFVCLVSVTNSSLSLKPLICSVLLRKCSATLLTLTPAKSARAFAFERS